MSEPEAFELELQRIASWLSDAIGGPVDLDDSQFRLLAYSSHSDDLDTVRLRSILERSAPAPVVAHLRRLGVEKAREPLRIAAAPDLGMQARVCVPIRSGETLLGFVWLLDGDQIDDAALALASRAAESAAEVLGRARLSRLGRRRREQELMELALAPDPADSRRGLEALVAERLLRGLGGLEVVVARGAAAEPAGDLDLAAEIVETVRRWTSPGEAACAATDSLEVVLILSGEDDAGIDRVTAHLTHVREDAVVGLAAADIDRGMGVALRRARWAAEVAAGPAGSKRVQRWERLGPLRYLADLPERVGALTELEPAMVALAATSAGRDLLSTMECYLDLGCDARAAASQLNLHRSSLYHRLSRCEEELEVSLRDGVQRLDLHLGLKAIRHAGLLGE